MIDIDRIATFNLADAILGMRNPLESWKLSDSEWDDNETNFCIGERDLTLAQTLIKSGTDDSKFMRQIFVSMDINAPIYWWKEMDTYKVGTTANSTSTMHKLAQTPITKKNFSFDSANDILIVSHTENPEWSMPVREVEDNLLKVLEDIRQRYLKTKSESYWRALIQLLPESWNQLRTWTANYQVLRSIYFARRYHKLSEWQTFCTMIENLPYGKELICYDGEENE